MSLTHGKFFEELVLLVSFAEEHKIDDVVFIGLTIVPRLIWWSMGSTTSSTGSTSGRGIRWGVSSAGPCTLVSCLLLAPFTGFYTH